MVTGCHQNEELQEIPPCNGGDEQVLGFPNQGTYASQGGAHRSVHHQATQKRAKLFEIFMVRVMHPAVVAVVVVIGAVVLARRDLVIHRVEANAHADENSGNGKGVQKCGQHCRNQRKQQRKNFLGSNIQKNFGEDIQEQILHEVDARHHEHQQQDDFEVGLSLVVNRVGVGHADNDGFDRKQAPWLQRIATQCQGQREDELGDQHPSSDEGADREKQDGVEDQKANNRLLVPDGGGAQKVVPQRLR